MLKRFAAVAAIVWTGAGTLCAGDLNPPPGAIQATNRQTINQQAIASLPYVITQPGSYVLIGNLTGVAGQHGIDVQSDDVTIDLNGFALIGVSGSLDGISAGGFLSNLTVENGLIRSWGGAGLNSNAENCQLDHLRASNNGSSGLRVGGDAEISHCVSNSNASAGIRTSGGSTVSSCTANSNGGTGIDTGGTVIGCTAGNNAGDGINVAGDSLVKDCRVVGNNRGITTGVSCTFLNCHVEGSDGDGIIAGVGASVLDCNARFNGGDGIIVGDGSTVSRCTLWRNTADGIQVPRACSVFENTCTENGFNAGTGAGIHATGNDNRIDGNVVSSNDSGIEVDAAAADNLVIRNSARANTVNYALAAATNQFGPVHAALGLIPAGVGPWANFAR